jgi:hypothetical protein
LRNLTLPRAASAGWISAGLSGGSSGLLHCILYVIKKRLYILNTPVSPHLKHQLMIFTSFLSIFNIEKMLEACYIKC